MHPKSPANLLCTASLIAVSMLMAPIASAQEIVIGQCAPMSGSLAKTGQDMALGVRLAMESANAQGGVKGRKIRLVQKDDAYQTDKTVSCTQEMIDKEKAVALIGYAGTGNVGELLKRGVLASAGIALVAPYTGGISLREPFNPNIFHIRASYDDEAEKMVSQFARVGISRISVFYQNDAFGESGLAGVEKALAKFNLKLASKGSYEKNTENVTKAVQDIVKGNPQAVIMVAITRPAAAFAKAVRSASMGVQVFSISVVDGQELYKLAGDEGGRGVGITQVMPSPFSGTLRIVREYHAALEKYGMGAEASYASFEEYVGGRVLIEALRRVTGSYTPASVMQALETINYDLSGYRITFGPRQRAGSKFVEVTLIGQKGSHMK